MEFACGNTLGTTVHCSYGAFWLSYAMFLIPSLGIQAAYGDDRRAYTIALGVYLVLWSFLTVLFLLASLRTNLVVIALFFSLALTYLVLALANFLATQASPGTVEGLTKAGGGVAVVCACFAFWAGIEGLMSKRTTMLAPVPLGYVSMLGGSGRRQRADPVEENAA